MSRKSVLLLFLSTLLGVAPLMAAVPEPESQKNTENIYQTPALESQLEEEQRNKTNATVFWLPFGDQQDYLVRLYQDLPAGIRDNIYPILGGAAVATLSALWWAFGRRAQPGRSAQAAGATGQAIARATGSSSSSSSSSSGFGGQGGFGGGSASAIDTATVPAALAMSALGGAALRLRDLITTQAAPTREEIRNAVIALFNAQFEQIPSDELEGIDTVDLQAALPVVYDILTDAALEIIRRRRSGQVTSELEDLGATLEISRRIAELINVLKNPSNREEIRNQVRALMNEQLAERLGQDFTNDPAVQTAIESAYDRLTDEVIAAVRRRRLAGQMGENETIDFAGILEIQREIAELVDMINSSLSALIRDLTAIYTETISAQRDFEAEQAYRTRFNDALREILDNYITRAQQDSRVNSSDRAVREAAIRELSSAFKEAIQAKARELNKQEIVRLKAQAARLKREHEEAKRKQREQEEIKRKAQQEAEDRARREAAMYTDARLIESLADLARDFRASVSSQPNGYALAEDAAGEATIEIRWEAGGGQSQANLRSSDINTRRRTFDRLQEEFKTRMRAKFDEKLAAYKQRQRQQQAEETRRQQEQEAARRARQERERREEQQRQEEAQAARQRAAQQERERQRREQEAQAAQQRAAQQERERQQAAERERQAQAAQAAAAAQRREQGNTAFTPIGGQAAPRVGYGVNPEDIAQARRNILGNNG